MSKAAHILDDSLLLDNVGEERVLAHVVAQEGGVGVCGTNAVDANALCCVGLCAMAKCSVMR